MRNARIRTRGKMSRQTGSKPAVTIGSRSR